MMTADSFQSIQCVIIYLLTTRSHNQSTVERDEALAFVHDDIRVCVGLFRGESGSYQISKANKMLNHVITKTQHLTGEVFATITKINQG